MREWFGHARITDGSLCGTEAVDCLSYASDTMIGSPERRCTPPLADLQGSGVDLIRIPDEICPRSDRNR